MDIFNRFATNSDLEVNGVEQDIGEGATLLIARLGNTKFVRLYQSMSASMKTRLESTDPDTKEAATNELTIAVMAQTILVGWDGVQFKGEDFPYNVENAKTLLAIPDFRKMVTEKSQQIEKYLAVQQDAVAKN